MGTYEKFAEAIVTATLASDAAWTKPWKVGQAFGLPRNAKTGKDYRGCNVLMLLSRNFASREWLTYKQAAEMGGHVRKGQKGTPIFFFSMIEKKNKKDNQDEDDRDDGIPFLRSFTVFNVEQIDGLDKTKLAGAENAEPTATTEEEAEAKIFADCEKMMNLSTWSEDSTSAYYNPSSDEIHLPRRRDFISLSEFWGTALHELAHWTGHASRLNRAKGMASRMGTDGYAREELVAESASWLLAATLGTPHEPKNSAAYLSSWVKKFADKPRELYSAIAQAQKAVDFLLEKSGLKIG